MKQILWFTLTSLAFVATSQAASFDCSKAVTKVEQMICADAELSKLDDELSAAYKSAILEQKQPDSIRQQQKQWINQRNHCSDTFCLKDKYKERVIDLHLHGEFKSDAEACQTVTDYANRDELKYVFRSSIRPIKSKGQEVIRIFGLNNDEQSRISETELWKADLNDDGISDYFALVIYRSNESSFDTVGYFLSGENGSTVLDTNGLKDSVSVSSLVTLNGRNFILRSQDSPNRELGDLLKVTRDGKLVQVCRFVERDKPYREITRGQANSVCLALDSHEIKQIDFTRQQNVVGHNITITGTAKVDLDNDGKSDDVGTVHYERVAGATCKSTEIKIIDPSNRRIEDSNTNKIISNIFNDCDVTQRAFFYDGLIYMDEQSTNDGSRTILLIKDGEGQKVCEFKGRILYNVNLAQ